MNATSLPSAPPTLPSEEQEQILQTIEMFEVIVQASPQDCQSLEILKDAYARLGRPEALTTSRRLADTYAELGQFSSAMLEYESILQRDPTNPEVIAAMGEVEEKLHKTGQPRPGIAGTPGAAVASPAVIKGIDLDFNKAVTTSGDATLITTDQTQRPVALGADGAAADAAGEGAVAFENDGNEGLARFLVQHRLAPEEVVTSALERVVKKNRARGAGSVAVSLIDEICKRGSVELDTLLCGILDRSKFAFIPLDCYDVDRSVVKMIPDSLTLGRLIVPFDVMSRTLMVALANPFDGPGKEAVQQMLDYNIQWHLASPQAIAKVLADTYRLTPAQRSSAPGPAAAAAPATNGTAAAAAPATPADAVDTSAFRIAR